MPPSGDEFIQLILVSMGPRQRPRLHMPGEAGQDGGIEPIGFGQDIKGFGEVADLSGIDDADDVPRRRQVASDGPFITAGGFQDDQTGSRRWEFSEQFLTLRPIRQDSKRGRLRVG